MMLVISLLIGVFVFSLIVTGWLVVALRHRQIMDIPGDRSSHVTATPRGGGMAIVAATLFGAIICVISPIGLETNILVLVAGGFALAAVSWIDDLKSLPPAIRFVVHAAVVGLSIPLLGLEGPVLPFEPPIWLDRILVGIAWLGFLNFFNFMDGIDGISVVETLVIGTGVIVLSAVHNTLGSETVVLAVVVSAAIGFGWWNWPPAKVFMGDVGSVFLGYLLGGYLILLAADGYLAAAMLLPAYYLIDATTTLTRRAFRGERVWLAHRQHFYQRAVRAGRSHATVSIAILLAGICLIGLASTSVHFPVISLIFGFTLAVCLCVWLPRTGSKIGR